jgi:hypothetical protein
VARIDKAWMVVRGTAGTALTGLLGVKPNAGGSIVPCGSSDALGVVVLPGTISAGRPVSVLVRGEVVEFGGTAGTKYYASNGGAGTLVTSATNTSLVGYTIEGDRLVVTM